MNLAQVVAAQKPVKPSPEPDKKTLEADSRKSQEAAKAVLTEIRASVDAVTKRYDELNSDATVKSALVRLKSKVGSFKLGPSPAFKATVKASKTPNGLSWRRKRPPSPGRKQSSRSDAAISPSPTALRDSGRARSQNRAKAFSCSCREFRRG